MYIQLIGHKQRPIAEPKPHSSGRPTNVDMRNRIDALLDMSVALHSASFFYVEGEKPRPPRARSSDLLAMAGFSCNAQFLDLFLVRLI